MNTQMAYSLQGSNNSDSSLPQPVLLGHTNSSQPDETGDQTAYMLNAVGMKPQNNNNIYLQNGTFQRISNNLGNSNHSLNSTDFEAAQVRTVFVTGFPPDVTPKEFHNLIRFFGGYEASQLHNKAGSSPQAFALFNSHAAAVQACNILNQLHYDTEYTLTAKIAHKNMYLKDAPTILRADSTGKAPLNIVWVNPNASHSSYPVSQGVVASYPPSSFVGHRVPKVRPGPGVSNLPGYLASSAAVASPVSGFAPILNKYDNPPCNTLFIGNLGDSVDEAELRVVFGSQFGFKQLKLIRNPRQVSCFVEFANVASAAAVHSSMQGAIFNSSDRGPIRIQYSKNPFGKRSAHPPPVLPAGLVLGDGMFLGHGSPGMLGFSPLGEVPWNGPFTMS